MSRSISVEAKSSAYKSLVLPILLCGVESWCLTESLLHKLQNVHHSCIRAMCRLNRLHVLKYRISNEQLLSKLNLKPIELYIFNRQLSWHGHASRMSFERLPRKLPLSWMCNRRPKGSPEFTYGRDVYKAFKWFDIDKKCWFDLASNRDVWRNVIKV